MTPKIPDGPPRIVLGVGGGIAAYKACELLRRLQSDEHLAAEITVIPTRDALRFVGSATFEALSGHPVTADVFDDVPSVAHVARGQDADLVVIAPATADLLARAASGRADDLLTATLLVTRATVLTAPAMHTEMWTHPATVANVATLRSRGITVLDPAVGRLTGADSGPGRLPDPQHLADVAELLWYRPDALPRDLQGQRIVVTAGGTREALDPVRFLGNRSSGRQGFAIALVAAARGATVTLIAAHTTLPAPPGVEVIDVTSADQMRTATDHAVGDPHTGADAVVMAAAVADFRPRHPGAHKIKKVPGEDPPPLDLAVNPDVLAGLVRSRGSARRPVIAGFAAETGDAASSVADYGRAKLASKGCDVMVVNDVSGGAVFGERGNAATILDADGGEQVVDHGPKTVLAAALCDVLAARLRRA